MNLSHKFAEKLAAKATERALWPWEKLFLISHLGRCRVCLKDALELAAFSREAEAHGLLKKELNLLHQRVMVQVRHQAQAEEKEARRLALKRPLVSPFFFPALGASALAVALLTLLTLPTGTGFNPVKPAGSSSVAVQLPPALPKTLTPGRVNSSPAPVSPTAVPTWPDNSFHIW
jgi:hypothetical protein